MFVVEAAWEEALEVVASNMQHIKSEYGSDAFGFISSSKVTNEEKYLMQKLARQIYGTNNVDNCSVIVNLQQQTVYLKLSVWAERWNSERYCGSWPCHYRWSKSNRRTSCTYNACKTCS